MPLTPAERERFPEVKDFQDFLKEKEISPDDPQVPLLKDVWNSALRSSSTYLRRIERDFRIESSLIEP